MTNPNPDVAPANAPVVAVSQPFITEQDIHAAGSDDPIQIGQMKLNQLLFRMTHSDADLTALVSQAKHIRDTYQAWAKFKNDLALRQKRYLGFQAVVSSLDLTAAATAMHTTPQAVAALMNGSAQQEGTRLAELQHMWDTGVLPATPVLSASDAAIVQGV